jgi:hypothetical protein
MAQQVQVSQALQDAEGECRAPNSAAGNRDTDRIGSVLFREEPIAPTRHPALVHRLGIGDLRFSTPHRVQHLPLLPLEIDFGQFLIDRISPSDNLWRPFDPVRGRVFPVKFLFANLGRILNQIARVVEDSSQNLLNRPPLARGDARF